MPHRKPPVILISSDEDDDHDAENLNDDDDDDDDDESEYSSEDDDDSDFDDQEEEDVDSDDEEVSDNDEELCDRVHRGSNDLQELSLTECKSYLKKHKLRLSGTKEECTQRIKEHQRLNDGRGELLYPRSSFSINCTGDACKGDVVLFTQRVYNKFDKASRRGNVLGKRTVAGRIVKESYGAAKQQHTFTVEVLWSKGFKRLPPLSTLLVKGRNLYRFRTYRQPWKSEAERSKVLGEKHNRGDAARHKRRLQKTEIAFNRDEGSKRRKLSHREPPTKQPTRTHKHGPTKTRGTAPVRKPNSPGRKKKTAKGKKMEVKKSTQPAFRSNPNPSIYTNHHPQEASTSFMQPLRPNLPPIGVPVYTHYNNGWARPDRPLYGPPDYRHNGHEQPVLRYPFH